MNQTPNPSPKVSVAMITYNHAAFIGQAIESVLMQETNFSIELVIGEDCSTDSTRDIVKKYAQSRPDIIRPLLHAPNIGMHRNTQTVLDACRGEYVAFLEGDDYWTAKDKLQKQLDFLGSHPDYVMSFHRVKAFWHEPDTPPPFFHPGAETCERQTFEMILGYNPIATCSVVVRRAHLQPLPENISALSMSDWPRWVLMTRFGDAHYFSEVMGEHRLHLGGVWSSMQRHEQFEASAHAYDCLKEHLPPAAQRLAVEYAARERKRAKQKFKEARRAILLREVQAQPPGGRRLGRMIKAAVCEPSILFWSPFVSVLTEQVIGKRLKSVLVEAIPRQKSRKR